MFFFIRTLSDLKSNNLTLPSLSRTTTEKNPSSHVVTVFLSRKFSLTMFPPLSQTLFMTFPLSHKLSVCCLKELTKFAGRLIKVHL